MDLLVNDLSVHGQFHNLAEFRAALSGLMAMRSAAKRLGRDIQSNSRFLNTCPISGVQLRQAIGNLDNKDECRAVMAWLNRSGPFWDDVRHHSADDWLECDEEIVTDTAAGEAAFRVLHGLEAGLVSLSPSDWNCTPVKVTWHRGDAEHKHPRTTLENWWDAQTLEEALRDRASPVTSWDSLRNVAIERYAGLTFSDDCFAPLTGVPFAKSVADRALSLLGTLDRFSCAFDADGQRTAEGHRMYQDYFTGERAWFSDSSDTEKQNFRRELTFAHPEAPASPLVCSWHGKVSHPNTPLRVHFSWPVEAGKPVYIVYAGAKLTKR